MCNSCNQSNFILANSGNGCGCQNSGCGCGCQNSGCGCCSLLNNIARAINNLFGTNSCGCGCQNNGCGCGCGNNGTQTASLSGLTQCGCNFDPYYARQYALFPFDQGSNGICSCC